MKGSTKMPVVFLSYSWSTEQHKQWIVSLAERLSSDGIKVVLDIWDLKPGHDSIDFMEKMVKDTSINNILVISDSHYQKKADERKGGVGTETQLISKKVYEDIQQEKFIPIIKEKDSDGKPCLPLFMKSRIYIDLSDDDVFEENYEQLVRLLYGKPSEKRPPIGTTPGYILEGEPINLRTANKTKLIENTILTVDKGKVSGQVIDYLDIFIENLEDFRITKIEKGEILDDIIIDNIKKMLPLRDDFIKFVTTIFKYEKNVDLEMFADFFERIASFQFKPQDLSHRNDGRFDHYRFFCKELFLYFITILKNLKKYDEISFFTKKEYFYISDHGSLNNSNCSVFNRYVASLNDIRNNRLKLNRVNVSADLLKERLNRKFKFGDIIETDIILHYILLLKKENSYQQWFPGTTVYNSRGGTDFVFFKKMISKNYSEMVQSIFGAHNISSLKTIMESLLKKQYEEKNNYGMHYYGIPKIDRVIEIEKIGTVN